MSAVRLRIFSDLHFRDPCSALQDLARLAPLLGDADQVVFNGDSIDTRVSTQARHLGELRAFAERSGREITWLSGNHDPDISPHAELLLRDERLWITHGDVFFDTIAPWSHHAAELRRRFAAASSGLAEPDRHRVETRLRLHREIVRALPEPEHLQRPHAMARLRRFAHTVFPPRRPFEMLRAWAGTPRRVAALALAQRPRARVVVLGHTHYPGVWRVPVEPGRPPLVVINTGSFTRPFGGAFVDIEDDLLRVRRIRRDFDGVFHAGRTLAEMDLRELSR
jgi:predicted phosphodiesterase